MKQQSKQDLLIKIKLESVLKMIQLKFKLNLQDHKFLKKQAALKLRLLPTVKKLSQSKKFLLCLTQGMKNLLGCFIDLTKLSTISN